MGDVSLVLQARTGSTRLPSKVLLPLGGVTVLEAQMIRLEELELEDFWLATTDQAEDDRLEEIASKRGWSVLRGDAENVLSRFQTIAHHSKPDIMVRCTGDNPLVDSASIQQMLDEIQGDNSLVSLRVENFDKVPIGLIPEVFVVSKLLELTEGLTLPKHHLSNVTSIFLEDRLWNTPSFISNFRDLTFLDWRFTLDYIEDFMFLTEFVTEVGEDWLSVELIGILRQMEANPELRKINGNMHQKQFYEY